MLDSNPSDFAGPARAKVLAPKQTVADAMRKAGLAAAFLGVYLLLDQISFIHPLQALNITPWNPQPALAVALIAILGRRWIAWTFVTVLAAEFVVRDLTVPIGYAVFLSAILTCGYAAIAWMLRGPLRIARDLGSRRDVLYLAAATVLGAGATGLVYITALGIGSFVAWSEYAQALFRFWLGDAIGMLVALPLLLLLADPQRRHEIARLLGKREVALQLALVAAALLLVFASSGLEQSSNFFYVLFLPLIWIAGRHGLAGAIGAVAVIQVGIIIAVMVNEPATLTVIELQCLLLALVLTGLFLGVTVDEWRSVSERLARAQQLTVAGELAAALAHELNQPLTAISTYADAIGLLAARGCDNAPLIDTVERVRRMANRCAEIVARLRSVGATSACRPARVRIDEPVRAAIAALREQAADADAEIDLEVEPELPSLALDANRLAFVFQNLIANALDAVRDRDARAARIRIQIRRHAGEHVEIAIHDSGPGIPAEASDKIFEPFYSGKAKGLGLGLAISRSIIESHGGRIWAEPAAHGIFRIRLPL